MGGGGNGGMPFLSKVQGEEIDMNELEVQGRERIRKVIRRCFVGVNAGFFLGAC